MCYHRTRSCGREVLISTAITKLNIQFLYFNFHLQWKPEKQQTQFYNDNTGVLEVYIYVRSINLIKDITKWYPKLMIWNNVYIFRLILCSTFLLINPDLHTILNNWQINFIIDTFLRYIVDQFNDIFFSFKNEPQSSMYLNKKRTTVTSH